MKPIIPIIPSLKLLLATLPLLISAGCTKDTGPANIEDTGTPPSLRSEQTAQIITLSSQQATDLHIETYTVSDAPITFAIDAPGEVFAAPERISVVSAPIDGRVAAIFAHEGEKVSKGDPLLELESLEFANLVADYLEATAEITFQEQQVERLRVLTEDKISPLRNLERAQADLRLAKTKQSAALARLRAIGITQQQMRFWDPFTSEPNAKLTLYASIDGVVNEHLIDLGESVNAYDKLLDIIDNTEVLVRGFVSPEDASFLQPGANLTISERSGDDLSGRTLSASVTTINPALDQYNKSVVLNSIVKTDQNWPLVGQSVRLTYQANPTENMISIPLSAIQFEQANATVFVQRSETEYEKRVVEISRMTAEHAILNSGLEPGEKVAVTQVFSLKALERFEQFAD
ncbi:efflux RND transporter periplasmic adaptor subunit [Gracilimonas tropica]|uniref:efflux RND transporter periplasmic adaptor subunit n=1 Tax=Gracilimonas tropica TaxID=454600 RepID=UPI0003681DC7|nr:efflux RND transporter periplasmic adaptor subunit [Gracilimonas tropica]